LDKKKLLKYASPVSYALVKAHDAANDPERSQAEQVSEDEGAAREEPREGATLARKNARAAARQQKREDAHRAHESRKELKDGAFTLNKCETGKLKTGKQRIAVTNNEVILLGGLTGESRVPLAGAVARVETTHQMTQRVSVAAELTVGLLASKARKYDLTYLTVEHPLGHGIHLEVWKREIELARKIAVAVNSAAQGLVDPEPLPVAVHTSQQGPADQLAKLGELHSQGILSDEEFVAAKAAVISNS
jgi:hypothetical protein